MNLINRTALSIEPKQPYLDWANLVATSYESMEEMSSTSKIILLSDTAYLNQESGSATR